MEIIPLLELNNRKIQNYDLIEKLDENILLYLMDLDGLEKNKPNLCHFQRLSKKYQIWVDNAPRTLGDIVDAFLTGAVNITIRKTFYPQVNNKSIREISENKIFANIEIYEEREFYNDFFFDDVNGMVNFHSREDVQQNEKLYDILKKFSIKNKIYIYENDFQNIEYWSDFNPEGYLVNISKYEEFKKLWHLKQKQ